MAEIFTSNTSSKEVVMIDDVVDLSPKTSNQDFTSIVNEQNKQLQADKITSKTDASQNADSTLPTPSTGIVYENLKYPSNIDSEEYKHRRVEIVVKDFDSPGGAWEDLKKKMDETWKQTQQLASNMADSLSNGGNKSIDATNGPGKTIRDANKAVPVYAFTLPLPTTELVDSQEHGWATTTSLLSKGIGALANLVTFGNGETVSKTVGELSSAFGYRKPLIDPGYFQDYTGTQPRRFSLTFTFVPNNAREAESIRKIIYMLKKFTLPNALITNVALRAPYFFDVKISNGHFSNLINLNGVVCSGLTVSYGTDGAMSMFGDGVPKVTTVTMSFVERFLVTADMYTEK